MRAVCGFHPRDCVQPSFLPDDTTAEVALDIDDFTDFDSEAGDLPGDPWHGPGGDPW